MWTAIILSVALILFFIFRKPKTKPIIETKIEEPKQILVKECKSELNFVQNREFDFVVIDFEYADRRQFACQLGIVTVSNGQIVDQIEYLIQPPENMYGIYESNVHGITSETTLNSPTFDKIWDKIMPYFHNQKIVCHGAATDINVLKKTCAYYQLPLPVFTVIDTLDVFGKCKLTQLAEVYGVECSNKHNALSDAFVLAQVYVQFLNGKQIFINKTEPTNSSKTDFSERKIKKDLLVQDLNVENKDNPFYNKTVVITGVFQLYSRNDIAEKFKSFGTNVNSAVSKKTDFVVVGADAGPSKLMKIADLNNQGASIKLLSTPELKSLMNDNFDFLK